MSMLLFSVVSGLWVMPQVFAIPEALPKILHVPMQYSTIQAAIDAANSGDIIQVSGGVYKESVMVNKTVSLLAENPSNTIIDANGTQGNTVHVIANNVKIEGFTIQNGENPFEASCLSIVRSRGIAISNNIIRQSHHGLIMRESNDGVIVNNVIANNSVAGIYLSSGNNNRVVSNLFERNSISVWITGLLSTINTFYHNNFINNVHSPSVFSPARWDNGTDALHTHTEGNYWSNYVGTDDGSGKGKWNETRVAGDRIGDTLTPHMEMDWYPLMNMWQNTLPTSNFTYNPTAPRENQEVNFTDTSTDPDGTVVAWLWNFGDGDTSTQKNPLHTYMKNGTYTITLTVTDNDEAIHTTVKTITVLFAVTDYTSYYVYVGIAAGAIIFVVSLFLWKRQKKVSSLKIAK